MKQFFKNIIIFSFFFILSGVLFTAAYYYKDKSITLDIPALRFSDSYSFNEKIRFLSTTSKNANIIAVGSSMTLNNLHSATVIQEMGSNKFLNTASWGMSIHDDYLFIKKLNNFFDIRSLIIVSNFFDFKVVDKEVDLEFVESYLDNQKVRSCFYFIKNFKLNYYLRNCEYAYVVRNCKNDYESLKYDKFGTVNLKKDNFIISKKRWIMDFCEGSGFECQYMYLDSISDFCKKNEIKLMFFQSPLRQGIFSKLSQSKLTNLQIHRTKVKRIIEKNDYIFVDANEKLWADSLFLDGIHFNEEGAQLFTQYCFDKMKEQTNCKSHAQ